MKRTKFLKVVGGLTLLPSVGFSSLLKERKTLYNEDYYKPHVVKNSTLDLAKLVGFQKDSDNERITQFEIRDWLRNTCKDHLGRGLSTCIAPNDEETKWCGQVVWRTEDERRYQLDEPVVVAKFEATTYREASEIGIVLALNVYFYKKLEERSLYDIYKE